ncbi:MAG: hypothetical protein OEY59_12665 [Deltaproteobacteria bacterium]|nr:hypothetical protein [Deltaproteobacteria bacterium]
MTSPHSKPIFVGGLYQSGKTTLIRSLIHLGKKFHDNCAGFKAFDQGRLIKNATEEKTDGEFFCEMMIGEPMETLVSPYIAHEDYPIEMAFRRDGIRIDWGFIKERLRILDENYDKTFIELPPGLYTPLNDKKLTYEWMSDISKEVIWIIQPQKDRFEHNMGEIKLLLSQDFNIHIIMNHYPKTLDQSLMLYIWETVEKFANQQIEGMIPFTDLDKKGIPAMAEKIELNVPGLINRLFRE